MLLQTIFDQIIDVPNGKWFNQIPGLEVIPNNTIIYKTKTGLGATLSEVLAERNSIILLPHVSIIRNKHAKYKDKYKTFAVFGDGQQTKLKDITAYLISNVKYKKFLTTPKGLEKIKTVFSQMGEGGMLKEFYEDYFLLIDECHKWVKDTGYRDDMTLVMDGFFFFKNKAMVSATTIPFSDPRFKIQKFRHVKLKPTHSYKLDLKSYQLQTNGLHEAIENRTLQLVHPYRKTVKLLQVNSLTNGLQAYLKKKQSDNYCIFFNSIQGIKSVIADLGITGQSRIFCSSESCKLLQVDEIQHSIQYDASDVFTQEDAKKLKKYNFFTSSFYTGLDIDLCIRPTIIILSDCYQAEHSIVDPYTDVLQIIGRFRNEMYDEVVHINNYESFTNALSDIELNEKISWSQIVYSNLDNLRNLAMPPGLKATYTDVMNTAYPFATFIDQNGAYSPYKEDNYRDLNRIKSYYSQPYKLIAAYRNSGLFNLIVDREMFEKDSLIRLKKAAGKYSRENNQLVAEALEELEAIKGTSTYMEYENSISLRFPIISEAFKRIGFLGLKQLNFRIGAIKRYMVLQNTLESRNKIPIDLIFTVFKPGRTYSRAQIKKELQKVYDDLELDLRAKATDIHKYFEVRYKNASSSGKSNSGFLLIDYKYAMNGVYRRK